MAFKIYSKHGDLRVALSPTDSSTQQEALQGRYSLAQCDPLRLHRP